MLSHFLKITIRTWCPCSSLCYGVIFADRRNVFVNLRIHIPERLLQLGGQTRTVLATNNFNHLKVYLYFSHPVLNSSAEILNSLNISQGSLLPISGNNVGNRRFGFLVSCFIVLNVLNFVGILRLCLRKNEDSSKPLDHIIVISD